MSVEDVEVQDQLEQMYSNSATRKKEVAYTILRRVKAKFSLIDEDATPVNWKCMFLVFLSLFSSSLNITFIFSFLPEMILTFGFKEEEKGYYAGFVASAMFVGRIFGCYFWGWLSDRNGRKPVTITTVALVGVTSLMFGFTQNIYFAVIVRFLSGLVNGTSGVAKTMLYDLTDDSNQAVGVSVAAIAWGTGVIIGPAVGGFLADPSTRYPSAFSNSDFFIKFPYILPSIFAFITCSITAIVDFIWLPETLNMRGISDVIVLEDVVADDKGTELSNSVSKDMANSAFLQNVSLNSIMRRAVSLDDFYLMSKYSIHTEGNNVTEKAIKSLSDLRNNSSRFCNIKRKPHRVCSCNQNQYCQKQFDNVNIIKEPDISSDQNESENLDKDYREFDNQDELLSKYDGKQQDKESHRDDNGCSDSDTTAISANCAALRSWSVVKLLSQFDIFLAIILYVLFSFATIGVEEIFTVWSSTDIMLDGLGFAPDEIGIVLGATAFPLLFIQLFLFPNLVRRFGIKKTMLICSTLLMVFTETMPCLHLLTNRPMMLWVLLMTNNILMTLMIYCVLSGTSLLINNSVRPEQAGQVNGLAMTAVAISRSISPIFGGTIFSWTVGYASEAIGPPFDVSFVFFAFGLVFWLVTVVCVTIPEHLNKQRK